MSHVTVGSHTVTVGIHNVTRITIKEKLYEEDADCHEFMALKITIETSEGQEPLSVDLYMDRIGLSVRKISDSLVERIIEVKK